MTEKLKVNAAKEKEKKIHSNKSASTGGGMEMAGVTGG